MSDVYNNFIFYKEWLQQMRIVACSDDPNDILSLIDGLETFLNGKDPDSEDMTLMSSLVYNQMTAQIMRDKEQYEEISRKRSEAGSKGAEAKKSKSKQTIANDSKSKQTIANDSLKEEDEDEEDVSPVGDIEGAEALVDIPLAKGKTFYVTQEIYEMLAECYPNVDTMQELRKMRAWSIANPKRRKVDGLRFVNNWFSFEQDKAQRARSGTPRKMTAEEILSLPAISPWTEAAQ